MGVLVCYDDFTYDVINDYFLDHLLTTGCIIGFDRSEHWVKAEEPAPATSFAVPRVRVMI